MKKLRGKQLVVGVLLCVECVQIERSEIVQERSTREEDKINGKYAERIEWQFRNCGFVNLSMNYF